MHSKTLSESKKVAEKSTPVQVWQMRFHEYLKEKTGGKEAWSQLMFGSNVALLMVLAADITSGAPCLSQDKRKGLREISKRLKKAEIPQVLSTAELIEGLSSRLIERSMDLTSFTDLPNRLRAYAGSIGQFAKIGAALSTERVAKTADFMLFFLHTYLTIATGRPQWGGLATLLEAGHAGHGRFVEIDEENLRKKIGRLRRKYRVSCSRLEQQARDYYSAGNGNWFTRHELGQMAEKFALRLAREQFPDLKYPE
jgi:hypothetical protein